MTLQSNTKRTAWLILAVCAVTMLPFLGLAEFNTKGEPREAVVAYSILESGDWILPTNNGGEMPYKPPFFHWCIAALSLLDGGTVDEYTSRLPSALALIGMSVWTYVFYARRKESAVALATALVAFTTFELHRAGANCRVDMVLTAATVGALYSLYGWWERGMRGVPWVAVLMMSIGTMTKGPVGSLLPCLATGIFMLVRGVKPVRALLLMMAWGAMSMILPLAWYAAAYLQGGREFLDLVMEENLGRMTNTMSYDSCVNPWPYNLLTLVTGFVPWTLAVVMGLFVLPYRKLAGASPAEVARGAVSRSRDGSAVTVFSVVAAAVIFLFYCFPQSKRSVYLMPMYPFTAYIVARMLIDVYRRKGGVVKAFGDAMAAIAVALPVCLILIKSGCVPDTMWGHGRHAAQNAAMVAALCEAGGFWTWIWVMVSPLCAAAWWGRMRSRVNAATVIPAIALTVTGIYISMAGAYQPAVLNVKSVKDIAREIDRVAPASEGRMYEFIEFGEMAGGDPVHYFEVNFYIGDRMASFYKNRPGSGFLLIGREDAEKWLPVFGKEGYEFEDIYATPRPLLGQMANVYRFRKNTD